jgi:carboxymethylenebutenolidase
MAALKEGKVYDVTVEHRTVLVDGAEIPVIHARPDGLPVAGLVLHPDIMGLRDLFEDMARRLATHGLAVCAVEPYARIEADRKDTVEARFASAADLHDDEQLAALEAAANLLVVEDDVTRVSVLGFCMGGYYTLKAAATDRFDAAVAFYGMVRTPDAWKGAGKKVDPIDVAAVVCPTLAIFGTNDQFVPNETVDELREAWKDRTDCEIVVVDGGEHGFVHDPSRSVHRAADAASLWARALEWVGAS